MSRIDELIRELCPEGVSKHRLGDVLQRRKGINITAGKMKTLSSGNAQVRIFAGGQTMVDVDSSQFPQEHLISEPGIIVKSRGNVEFAYWETMFTHKSEIWSYTHGSDEVNVKYVFYLLKSKTKFFQELARSKSVKMPQLSVGDTDDLIIPVPPPEVQREIVSILDKFTQLEAELEAELEARRTQYEVTRERLLNFSGDLSAHPMGEMIQKLCPEGVRYLPMGEAGSFIRGQRFVKDDMRSFGEPCIHYGEVYTKYGMEAQQTISFLEADLAKKLRKAQRGDVVIAAAGETVEDIGKPVVWNGDGEVVIHDALYAFKSRMNPKFVAHFLRTDDFKTQARKLISSSKISAISIGNFNKVIIPEPPIEVQREIVSILDKLDALVNDITYGLPAEIEARRKQYEYYRNKLLTFKELDAA